MAVFVDKRKRSREDDVYCDSTPLSKRINNLHLTNFDEHQRHQDSNNLGRTEHLNMQQHVEQHQAQSLQNTPSCITNNEENYYNPDLNESENPYYYSKNKILYHLHFERLKRCNI